MATDSVSIVNSALDILGVEAIASLSDTSKQAVLANRDYAKVRDDMLCRYFWDFAIKQSELTEDASAPTFEYTNQFVLPADYLRAWYVYPAGNTEWVIQGEFLMTDEDTVKLVYIAQITDTTKYTKTFDEALALKLAHKWAYTLVQSVSLKKTVKEDFKEAIRDVRSIDAMVGTPIDPNDDIWLRSRIGGHSGDSPYFGTFRAFP